MTKDKSKRKPRVSKKENAVSYVANVPDSFVPAFVPFTMSIKIDGVEACELVVGEPISVTCERTEENPLGVVRVGHLRSSKEHASE